MKVLYCAPNKSHHYGYARELHDAGILHAFVSGFPRVGSGASIPELSEKLIRADELQLLYLASLRAGIPNSISEELLYWSKLRLDRVSRTPGKEADLFLFYGGCGLQTARRVRERGGITVMEAVNSHVLTQQELLREQYQILGLPWRPFHPRETERRVLECDEADYILLPSEFVRRSFLNRGFPERKLLKVPFKVRQVSGATESFTEPFSKQGVFRILFVGSISVRKGVRYLIEAFRRLQHPNKELWLVGPTSTPSGLEGMQIPAGVSFKGILKGSELQHAYRSSTLFCLPTLEEGLALVLGEALGNGLPVITTSNSGAEDLYTNGKEGVITPIRDTDSLLAAMQRAVDDPTWLAELKHHAQLRAIELRNPPTHSLLVETIKSLPRSDQS
jgi:glycosyltransferase involved in cell wall biosynthesis